MKNLPALCLSVMMLGFATPLLADDADVKSNVSLRFKDWHFDNDPVMLAPPASLASVESACGSIHNESWTCASADADVMTYRAVLEERWSGMSALMDRIQRTPQRYDRHDVTFKLSEFGLKDSQMHEGLIAKRKQTLFVVKMFEN